MISDSARLHIWIGTGTFAVIAALVIGIASAPEPELRHGQASVPAYCTTPLPELHLSSTAAYAEDIHSGAVLYQKNADAQLPLASLTKVMTVLTASKNLAGDGTTTISRAALAPDGDAGLLENEKWRVQDLMDFTLMTSANDGAHALALAAAEAAGKPSEWFVDAMNEEAVSIGLGETYFLNDTGLDLSSTTAGAYGSARDVAHLMKHVIMNAPRVVEGTSERARTFFSASDQKHDARNTTSVAAAIEGLVASKTGFTDLAGGNLVAVFEPLPGRPVVASIMGGEREERDKDMATLAEAAVRAQKRTILCEQFYDSH